MKKTLLTLATIISCQTAVAQSGGREYDTSEVGRAYTVKTGLIIDLRDVRLSQTQSSAGYRHNTLDSSDGCAAFGAVLGGLLGSRVGSGVGRAAATIAIGGLTGYAGKQACSHPKDGVEIIVKMEDSSVVAVVQGSDERFAIGDKVRFVEGQRTRVTRISN